MSLAGLLSILDDDPRVRDVAGRAEAGPDAVGTDLVAPPALRPVLAAALTRRALPDSPGPDSPGPDSPGPDGPRFVLAVTATAREAEDLAAGLGSFLPPDSVATFPGW